MVLFCCSWPCAQFQIDPSPLLNSLTRDPRLGVVLASPVKFFPSSVDRVGLGRRRLCTFSNGFSEVLATNLKYCQPKLRLILVILVNAQKPRMCEQWAHGNGALS
jgi:hypothetical protein